MGRLHHQPVTFALLLLAYYAFPILANTEIINFAAGNPVPVAPLPENWTVLHRGANEIIVRDRTPAPLTGAPNDPLCDDDEDVHPFKRRPCPHELWLALDLDANGDGNSAWDNWKGYDRFTLRSARTARVHLARIRLTQEGIRVPHRARRESLRGEVEEEEGVPLVVLLEPLMLGVLPASVLPTVAALLGVLGAVACGVLPFVWGVLAEVAARTRREVAALEERKER
ncbi:hypothetical protein BC826DRAFT_994024 [Russula brevipes]|nr:hypothetical protein BC826DRAFT_994024 [Russula brevipes]